jgi:protease-4
MAGLFDKVGVETEIIKSGELKDMGQPTGPLTDDARQVITGLIDEVFSQFVDDVAAGREMDRQDILALADGRIYTGQQAQENGLVDAVGGYHEALMEAGRLAGITGKPAIKEYGVPSLWRMLLEGSASVQQTPVAVNGGLLYDHVAARLAAGGLAAPGSPASPFPEAQ